MAHPYASQAKASQARRLGKLGAKAGKSYGSSSMYKKTSYPSKNAGTSRELTISGKTAKGRADRPSNKFASGGFVGGGGGGGAKKKKGHSTTNIIIASPGGGAGAAPPRPVPVPVPRPVPVPVAAGGPPVGAARPPMPPPGVGGGPPINVNVPPPAAAGPVGPPPGMRPPGMAGGGLIGSSYHNWGKGFADGGHVKKKANGGMTAGLGMPGAAPGVRPGVRPGACPPVVPLVGKPGGPGVRGPGYKKGGVAHDDEAQDKKLIAKMIKQEDKTEKKKSGGSIKGYDDGGDVDDPTPQASSTSVSSDPASASKFGATGIMKALGGVNKALSPTPDATGNNAVRAAQAAQTAAEKAGQSASASTQSLGKSAAAGFKPGAVPGAFGGGNKFQIAKDGGGIKKLKAGGATGQGRLAKIAGARAVPAKTEV